MKASSELHAVLQGQQPKLHRLLNALLRGEAITLEDSVSRWRLFALSQGVGFWRKRGLPVQTEMVRLTHSDGTATVFARYRVPASQLAEARARFRPH